MEGLAKAEARHEKHWLDLLGPHALPPPRPKLRTRLLNGLASRFGSVFALAMAQRSEHRTSYDVDSDATAQMAADEHIHGEVVRSLAASSREQMAGNFRAAVFGINDGLMSNLALILGVAGAGMDAAWILATGLAGLLAGSLSMAAGEWISVSGQKELLDASIPDPQTPQSVMKLDVDENELELLFLARGETAEEARLRAQTIFEALGNGNPEGSTVVLSSTLTEESGSGAEAVGHPIAVALASFAFFALGAFIPLIPYLFNMEGIAALVTAGTLVGVALMITGALVGILSGKAPWFGALRQLSLGVVASVVTYGLGLLFGSVGH